MTQGSFDECFYGPLNHPEVTGRIPVMRVKGGEIYRQGIDPRLFAYWFAGSNPDRWAFDERSRLPHGLKPIYFSERVFGELFAEGFCFDGSLCAAMLPPPLLTHEILLFQGPENFQHEGLALAFLRRRFPKIDWEPNPDRECLGREASEWGL